MTGMISFQLALSGGEENEVFSPLRPSLGPPCPSDGRIRAASKRLRKRKRRGRGEEEGEDDEVKRSGK